jgi:Arc/MetJ-type ribon-helix-helix transcriptional regulator
MRVQLKPELESLVRADVARGPYQSVDEFIERAVELLHEHEEWLSKNQVEIGSMIDVGFAQAERGELLDPEQALVLLRKRRETRSRE